MTGDEDPKRSNDSRRWPDDDNPFVAFRRYADEQISSMLQSVMGLPSIVSSPPPDHWAIFDDTSNKRAQFLQTQHGNDNEGESPSSAAQYEPENADKGTSMRSRWPESDDHNSMNRLGRHGTSDLFDIDFFFDSFFDKFWFDDQVSNRFFHPYHRPMFSSMVNDDSPAWPVYYLMFSPYSPLHLERQAQYRSHRDKGVFTSIMSSLRPSSNGHDPAEPQWREAFEDLLRLENGRPMLDRGSADVYKAESGRDWLNGLAKRGSLGDHWKYVPGTDGKPWTGITYDSSTRETDPNKNDLVNNNAKTGVPWDVKDNDTATELDLYDRFLADIEAREREFFSGAYESPLLRLIFDDRRRRPDDRREKDENNWSGLINTEQEVSTKESQPHADTPEATIATTTDSNVEQKPYVTSTSTSTERVRLSDGSIRTKIIKTQRFSDGREESNESVEIFNPPQNKADSGQQEGGPGSDSNTGWFWKGN